MNWSLCASTEKYVFKTPVQFMCCEEGLSLSRDVFTFRLTGVSDRESELLLLYAGLGGIRSLVGSSGGSGRRLGRTVRRARRRVAAAAAAADRRRHRGRHAQLLPQSPRPHHAVVASSRRQIAVEEPAPRCRVAVAVRGAAQTRHDEGPRVGREEAQPAAGLDSGLGEQHSSVERRDDVVWISVLMGRRLDAAVQSAVVGAQRPAGPRSRQRLSHNTTMHQPSGPTQPPTLRGTGYECRSKVRRGRAAGE